MQGTISQFLMEYLPILYTNLDVHKSVSVHTHPSVTDSAVSAVAAICPREMSGLADQMPTCVPCAPKLGAWVHVWAGLRAGSKGQLTLAVEAVAGARKVLWESQLVMGLVQKTFS